MPATTKTSTQLRQHLVEDLERLGALRSPHWRAAFLATPREYCVSRFAVANPVGDDQWFDLTDPATHDAALAAVYSNNTLITQYDENGTGISSSTQPSLMALMLEHLDAKPGQGLRVMEIGLGRAYNNALLCAALGDGNVVSMDIDPHCVHTGREALHRMGFQPHVLVGDGAEGVPDHAPFDRIIATCGFDRVPSAWLEQTTPGAVIVVNLGFGLARLTTSPDGTASGPLVDYAAFMTRRPTAGTVVPSPQHLIDMTSGAGVETRARRVDVLHGVDARPFQGLRSLAFPTIRQIRDDASGEYRWITRDGSWSRLAGHGDRGDLVEHGPRSVYDDIARLYTEWNDHGRPEITRYGLTIQRNGTHLLWLDEPAHTVCVLG